MIEGIFTKNNSWNFFFTISISTVLIFALRLLMKTNDSTIPVGIFVAIGIGVIMVVCSIFFKFFNRNAYLFVENNRIKGKFGWSSEIDCDINDVEFVHSQTNTLIIKLKNGQQHVIMGILNSYDICSVIRKNISLDTTCPTEIICERLKKLKSQHFKGIITTIICVALMFVWIFLTAFLTGNKELEEFSKIDWYYFYGMIIAELLTVSLSFIAASQTGKKAFPIAHHKFMLKRKLIETAPIVPGNIKHIITDENFDFRAVIYGYPNSTNVYYSVQQVDENFNVLSSPSSKIFESEDKLPFEVSAFIDITDKVLGSN